MNPKPSAENIDLLVLGIAQDAGVPQAGCRCARCQAAGQDPSLVRRASALAIHDPQTAQRWMVDATPDFRAQLAMMDAQWPVDDRAPGLAGILLTHAHFGHYPGLLQLGPEVMHAKQVPVYVMPRMAEFLRKNEPWASLVEEGNINLQMMQAGRPIRLSESLQVTPFPVPHRTQLSETVGFIFEGPNQRVGYIPDIDRWKDWTAETYDPSATESAAGPSRLLDFLSQVDLAYLDASFYNGQELPHRNMDEISHPTVEDTLEELRSAPSSTRSKVRLIHLNHSNPLLDPGGAACKHIESMHVQVACEGEIHQI